MCNILEVCMEYLINGMLTLGVVCPMSEDPCGGGTFNCTCYYGDYCSGRCDSQCGDYCGDKKWCPGQLPW